MRGVRLLFASIIVLIILGTGIALGETEATESPEGPRVEIPSDRTATSQTFRRPDELLETEVSESAINYRDTDGQWQPIEEGLKEDNGAGLTNGNNSFDLNLPSRMGSGPVRITLGEQWVTTELRGPSTEQVEVEGDTASYETQSGESFDFSGLANGLKEDIEVADISQPSTLSFDLDASVGLTPELNEEGGIDFKDPDKKAIVTLPAPMMSDSAPGQPAISYAIHYRLDENPGAGWTLTVEAERAWLESSDRVWPVHIDPTLTVESPSLDCTYGGTKGSTGWGLCGSGGQKELYAAYKPTTSTDEWKRSLLRFNIESIPSEAYVSSATVSLHAPSAVKGTSGLELRRTLDNWTSGVNWKTFNGTENWHTEGAGLEVPAIPPEKDGIPGDYSTEGGEVLTSKRGSQAGWWEFPEGLEPVIQRALLEAKPGHPNGTVDLLLKLLDDKSRECSGSTCTERSAVFDSSAAVDPNNRPKLKVIYFPPASKDSKVVSPMEGTHSARTFRLTAGWTHAGVTGVTFQYKLPKGAWTTIPTSAVKNFKNEKISWPIPTNEAHESRALYWNAPATGEALTKNTNLQIRAILEGTAGASGYTEAVNVAVDRDDGSTKDATAPIGPGMVDLLTGAFEYSHSSVSISSWNSALELSQTYVSREGLKEPLKDKEGSAEPNSVLGPHWTPSVPVQMAGGSNWRGAIDFESEAGEGYAVLVKYDGTIIAFPELAGGAYASPEDAQGYTLTRTSATQLVLTDSAGNKTTFEKSTGSAAYKPTRISQTGGESNATRLVYEYVGNERRLSEAIAPSAPGLDCSVPTSSGGCQILRLFYMPTPNGVRLERVVYTGYGKTSESVEVAHYAYDSAGRLEKVWDPRTPEAVETYSYDANGLLSKIAPPGTEPWSLSYRASGDDAGAGRLWKVSRATLDAAHPVGTTTLVYGVPVTGTSAPQEMSGTEVGRWAQTDLPTDATAVFPPDQEPAESGPPSSYSRATIHYLDAEGQEVNVAEPGGAIATSERDVHGNVVRELTPNNRAAALEVGSGSAARAQLLDTHRTYSEDGTELLEEFGPLHTVKLQSTGKTVEARFHKTVEYNAGWNKVGPNPHAATSETIAASLYPPTGQDQDVRTTNTEYDYTLRKPSATIVDPGTLKLKSSTVYDDVSGLAIEQRQPSNAGGGGAGTTKIIYYTTAQNPQYPSCSSTQYAGLRCEEIAAAQPSGGLPKLVVTRFTSYDIYGHVTKKVEEEAERPTPGKDDPPLPPGRTTATTYEGGVREASRTTTGGKGTELPGVKFKYDPKTGNVIGKNFVSGAAMEIKLKYDQLGRLTAYEDGTGGATTISYDWLGRPTTHADNKGTDSMSYDAITGQLTTMTDSAEGGTTFTAKYDLDGNVIEQKLPGGLVEYEQYDSTGTPTGLQYVKTTNCSSACTWLSFGALDSIHKQEVVSSGSTGTQEYEFDGAGRVRLTKDTEGGKCTTRSYSYDADSNRTVRVTRAPGETEKCDTNSTGTIANYSYDTGDRLTGEGISYDEYGRITSLPSKYAGGSALSTTFYNTDAIQSQSRGGVTNSFVLDAKLRQSKRTRTGSPWEVFHYDYETDLPSWTEREGARWSRNISGIDGNLIAIQDSVSGFALQLRDLHGDLVATASKSSTATGLLSQSNSDEFGNPKQSSSPQFAWLGAKERRTEFSSGIVQMGVRSYIPSLGRFISPDPVIGGALNPYDYAGQDPVNQFDLSGCSFGEFVGCVSRCIGRYCHAHNATTNFAKFEHCIAGFKSIGGVVACMTNFCELGKLALCSLGCWIKYPPFGGPPAKPEKPLGEAILEAVKRDLPFIAFG